MSTSQITKYKASSVQTLRHASAIKRDPGLILAAQPESSRIDPLDLLLQYDWQPETLRKRLIAHNFTPCWIMADQKRRRRQQQKKTLHPIYTALDHHQYNRAVKLCLAAPPDALVTTLLAHAYAKNGQRRAALRVVCRQLLTDDTVFCEVHRAYRWQKQLRTDDDDEDDSDDDIDVKNNTKKKTTGRKKGKKAAPRPTRSPASAATTTTAPVWEDPIDAPILRYQPVPTTMNPPWTVDGDEDDDNGAEQVVPTLTVTLHADLQLPITTLQVAIWAATTGRVRSALLDRHALDVSLHVAIHSNDCWSILPRRALALRQTTTAMVRTTAWAAMLTTWQLRYDSVDGSDDDRQRQLLPVLAERLAKEAWEATLKDQDNNSILLLRRECFELYWSCLHDNVTGATALLEQARDVVSQHQQQQEEGSLSASFLDEERLLDCQTLLAERSGQTEAARTLLSTLLRDYAPDDMGYWRRLVKSCSDSVEVEEFVNRVLEDHQKQHDPAGRTRLYPIRAPHLVRIELAVKKKKEGARQAIQNYIVHLGYNVPCVVSDVLPYVQEWVEDTAPGEDLIFAHWIREHLIDDLQKRTTQSYMAGTQLLYHLVLKSSTVRDHRESLLPTVSELISLWQELIIQEEEQRQEQKDGRPSDEVLLLAIQQLLYFDSSQENLVTSCCLLEFALAHSPHSPYLKIMAIHVYASLQAGDMAWKQFNGLQIKHIQYESTAFLILDVLVESGLYRETIRVCQEILRLQTSSLSGTKDYVSVALDQGALSKAHEFVLFQRSRMNCSLTTLQAKGLVLDCASMYVDNESKQDALGAVHGIIGPDDADRSRQMLSETHNPTAAFSLLRINGNDEFSDNRDLEVFHHEIFPLRSSAPSKLAVLQKCMLRGHVHKLLIRSSLCLDQTKGPKKGKVTKTAPDQEERCRVLRRMSTEEDVNTESLAKGGEQMMLTSMHLMCKALAVFGAGVSSDNSEILSTLDSRESTITGYLEEASKKIQEANLFTDKSLSFPLVSRWVAEFFIPTTALCRMCAKGADLYGWGPRKATKICALAVASLVESLNVMANGLLSFLRYV